MRLLCATDLSARSDRAVRRAAGLTRRRGAELLMPQIVDDDRPTRLAETGNAFDAVIRAGATQVADLVVRHAPRRGLLKNLVVGATAERVVRGGGSGGPMPIANLLPTGLYRRVLAVVDMSEASARALRAARTALGLLGDGPEQPA